MRHGCYICWSSSLGVDVPSLDLKLIFANAVVIKVRQTFWETERGFVCLILFMPLHVILYFVAIKFSELCFVDCFVLQNVVSGRKSYHYFKKHRKKPVSLSLHVGLLLTWKCVLNRERHTCSTARDLKNILVD